MHARFYLLRQGLKNPADLVTQNYTFSPKIKKSDKFLGVGGGLLTTVVTQIIRVFLFQYVSFGNFPTDKIKFIGVLLLNN